MNISRVCLLLLCMELGLTANAQGLMYEHSEQARQVQQNIGAYPREGSLQIQLPPALVKAGAPIGSVCTDTNADGIELAIFDGTDWVRVISRRGDDGSIHWYDLFSSEIKDSIYIQDSSYVSYKIPQDAAYLAVSDIVQLPLCGPTTPILYDKEDVEKCNNLLAQVIAKNRGDPTIAVFNMPDRLAVKLADGRYLPARYSKSTGMVIELQKGYPIFNVDEPDYAIKLVRDDSAPQDKRLDEVGIKTIEVINGLTNPQKFYKELADVILDAAEERERRNSILGITHKELIMFIASCVASFLLGICSNLACQKFSTRAKMCSKKPSGKN